MRVNPFSFQPTAMPAKTNFAPEPSKSGFSNVLGNMVGELNTTMVAPDSLMQRAITTGDVDVHDVMMANAKADIAVNVASQVLTKIIQAYERVQQIQV
jgi:flagellar hook-basal body complex protein FliE